MSATRPKRILAVSSGGGHWTQLLIIIQAFEAYELSFACTTLPLEKDVPPHQFTAISDFNLKNLSRALPCILDLVRIFWRVRPDIVISTGAAPGLAAIIIAAVLRRQSIWIDSIANEEKLSLSGRVAGMFATNWLTQWPHLARTRGPGYIGSVM